MCIHWTITNMIRSTHVLSHISPFCNWIKSYSCQYIFPGTIIIMSNDWRDTYMNTGSRRSYPKDQRHLDACQEKNLETSPMSYLHECIDLAKHFAETNFWHWPYKKRCWLWYQEYAEHCFFFYFATLKHSFEYVKYTDYFTHSIRALIFLRF